MDKFLLDEDCYDSSMELEACPLKGCFHRWGEENAKGIAGQMEALRNKRASTDYAEGRDDSHSTETETASARAPGSGL